MKDARGALLALAVAAASLASISSCGTSRRQIGGISAGSGMSTSGSTSSGGTPVDTGANRTAGTSAAGGPFGEAGTGGALAGDDSAGGGAGATAGADGVDACDAPATPGCFSCCDQQVCPANFADCDDDPSDCETALGAEGACTPTLATVALPSFGIPTVNADGSYFIVGSFVETTDFDPGPAEDVRTPVLDDVYVSKFSSSGAYLWTYTFGKRVFDANAASGADGSVIVAGSFVRATDPDPDSGVLYTDAFVFRIGADGKPVWQRVFDGVSAHAGGGAHVATDSDGTVIVSAIFGGDVDFGLGDAEDVRHFGERSQGYLFELDASGAFAWSRAIGDGTCGFYAQELTVSRAIIAARPSVNFDCVIDGKPLGSGERRYAPLVTFTRQGELRNVSLLTAQRISGLLAYDDGSVVASGMFTDELRLGDPGTVIADEHVYGSGFMLRFSKDARLQWLKVIPYSALGDSLARAPDGGVLGALSLGSSQRHLALWHADGTPAWTGALECTAAPLIASNGAWFMLKSDDFNTGACDLEPGPTSEPESGAPYLVRYQF